MEGYQTVAGTPALNGKDPYVPVVVGVRHQTCPLLMPVQCLQSRTFVVEGSSLLSLNYTATLLLSDGAHYVHLMPSCADSAVCSSCMRSAALKLESASCISHLPACIHADTSAQRNNSDYARRLIAANGVVMGKTRMHELAYGVTSINPVFGPVLNPYDVTKIPGGRSA